ncbi:MAG: hypothetical protein ACRC8S_02135 [Fimbriiglobus sp.]
MFRSIIHTPDPKIGAIPETLREGIAKANIMLQEGLPIDSTEVLAEWRYESTDEQGIYVRLMLFITHRDKKVGIVEYPLDADVFSTEYQLRNGLATPIFLVSRTLLHLLKFDNGRQRKDLLNQLAVGAV